MHAPPSAGEPLQEALDKILYAKAENAVATTNCGCPVLVDQIHRTAGRARRKIKGWQTRAIANLRVVGLDG